MLYLLLFLLLSILFLWIFNTFSRDKVYKIYPSQIKFPGTLRGVKIPKRCKSIDCSALGLKSLEGCPDITELNCSNNELVSFDYFPKSLVRLDVSRNQFRSLAGCPENITHLRISNNPLESLIGCPQKLISLGCSFTHLKSFIGCPSSIMNIVCAHAFIKSLEGLPRIMNILYVSYNPDLSLNKRSLENCPRAKILDLSANDLDSLTGLPMDGIEELEVSNNRLNSLLACPDSVRILRASSNRLSSIEGCGKNVTLLNVANNPNFFVEDVAELMKSTMLRELMCSKTRMNSDAYFYDLKTSPKSIKI